MSADERHCESCGRKTYDLVSCGSLMACFTCARSLRESALRHKYPPPNLWVQVQDTQDNERLEAILVDAYEDNAVIGVVYTYDGESTHTYFDLEDDLLPQTKKPRYVIPYHYKDDVTKWLKEIT